MPSRIALETPLDIDANSEVAHMLRWAFGTRIGGGTKVVVALRHRATSRLSLFGLLSPEVYPAASVLPPSWQPALGARERFSFTPISHCPNYLPLTLDPH